MLPHHAAQQQQPGQLYDLGTNQFAPKNGAPFAVPPRPISAQHGQYGSPAPPHAQVDYSNGVGAYGQQQHGGAMMGSPAAFGTQQAGGAPPSQQAPWPQPVQQQQQQYQQQQHNMYMNPGGGYGGGSGGGGGTPASSTASLFQQQLAQQQAMSSSPAPPPPNYQNLAHSQQAYLQQQQAYQQQQQQAQAQAQARASQPPPLHQPSLSQSPAPQSKPSPFSQPPRVAGHPSMQDLKATLSGVNLNGMTAERFQQLLPHQQVAVREFLTRSRQAQQAQLGLGMPGPAAPSPRAAAAASPPARPPTAQSQQLQPQPQQPQPQQPQAQPQSDGMAAAGQAQGPAPGQQQQQPAPGPPAQSPQAVAFLKTLGEFYSKKGLAFHGAPVIEGRPLDLARMFAAVTQTGGLAAVTNGRKWGHVASGLGFPAAAPDQHPEQRLQTLMQAYQQLLYPFEQYWTQAQQARLAQAQQAQAQAQQQQQQQQQQQHLQQQQQQQHQHQRSQIAAQTASPMGPGATPSAEQLAQPTTPSAAAPGTPQQGSSRPSTATTTRPASRAAATPAPATAAASPLMAQSVPPGAPSPFASANGTRPGTASGPSEDLKAKAKEEDSTDDNSLRNAAPSAPLPATAPAPALPVGPPRRKRRRIEYAPLARPIDTYGGTDLALVEAIFHRLDKMRPRRTIADLGTVDVHGLTMSLRSRLASEVSYALNALATIAMAPPHETRFKLRDNADLVEELLDLLEETAFGLDGAGDDDEGEVHEPSSAGVEHGTASCPEPDTYRRLFSLVEEEASEPAPLPPPPSSDLAASSSLRPAEVTLAVVNLVRTFAFDDDDAQFLIEDGRAAALLVRAASLPLERARHCADSSSSPSSLSVVHVTAAQSMALKKAALETLAAFGTSVRLDAFSPATAAQTVALLLFFVRHPHTHREPWAFDLSNTPGMAAKQAQVHAYPPASAASSVTGSAVPPYLDLGLSTFARLVLPDANRAVVARLLDPDELHALFDALVRLLPVAEADFQLMTFEVGIVHVHNTIMTLYNLAFLAPASVRLRLRADPKAVKSLLRVVRRLVGTLSASHDTEIWQGIAERCMAILRLLDDVDRPVSGAKAAQQGAHASLPWWGLSMSGLDDDDAGAVDEGPPSPGEDAAATGEDGVVDQERRASTTAGVKRDLAHGPGSSSSAAAAGPILAGERRALFEAVQMGSLQLAIPALAQMADATRGSGGRRRRR